MNIPSKIGAELLCELGLGQPRFLAHFLKLRSKGHPHLDHLL